MSRSTRHIPPVVISARQGLPLAMSSMSIRDPMADLTHRRVPFRIGIIPHPRAALTRSNLHPDLRRERGIIVIGRVSIRVIRAVSVSSMCVGLERRGVLSGIVLLICVVCLFLTLGAVGVGQGMVLLVVGRGIVECEGRSGAEIASAQSHVVVVRRRRVGGEVHVGAIGEGSLLLHQHWILERLGTTSAVFTARPQPSDAKVMTGEGPQ